MRRFFTAACATTFGITLSTAFAVAGSASAATTHQARPAATIVVSPGQSIQAAVNHARPGDTVLLKPGVYHQSADPQIRTDGITLRGGQKGGAGNAAIFRNVAIGNNKFCAKSDDTPVNVKGGGILLLGGTLQPAGLCH